MTTQFLPAYQFMAPHEWRMGHLFTDIPGDPGGATMRGITLASLQRTGTLYDLDHDGKITVADLKLMTEEDTQTFYKSGYWDVDGVGILDDQRIASKVFDITVNLSPVRGIIYLQEVLNEFGKGLLLDGRMGPATANAVAACNSDRVLDGLVTVLTDHYNQWVNGNPALREQFLEGLLTRAKALPC